MTNSATIAVPKIISKTDRYENKKLAESSATNNKKQKKIPKLEN